MRKRFRSPSIAHTLVHITMITSTVALVIATAVFITNDFFTARRSLKASLFTLARVTGINCAAALTFNDYTAAEENLMTFAAVANIRMALVLRVDGNPFASYPAGSVKKVVGKDQFLDWFRHSSLNHSKSSFILEGNYKFEGQNLHLIEPIFFEGELLGWIYLQGDLNDIYHRMKWDAFICFLILLLCSSLVFLLSNRLLSRISSPILNLANAMERVSLYKDYNLRIKSQRKDEIGTLIRGFNDMLFQIQEQDRELRLTQYSIDHMADAAFWTRSPGKVIYVNLAACRKLGYSAHELIQMNVWDFDAATSKERIGQIWMDLGQDESYSIETIHRTKSGHIFPVEVTISRVDFEGNAYHCCFARDISERKQMEQQLQQAQKMEAIGTLAAGVAHDLNNVLGGLVSYPELLLLEIPEDSHLHDTILTIQKSGQKAADIVQDLLTLARRGVATTSTISLNSVITDYLKSPEFAKLCSYHTNVDVSLELAEDLLNINASQVHLSKTLMNLVSNAAEAMPTGGQVKVKTENRSIDRPFNSFERIDIGDYAVLIVADTGIGISEEDLKKIFEPFFTKKVMGRSGTGLGMSVIWATVKDHHGFVDVFSNEGEGTCFELYFPITQSSLTVPSKRFSIDDCLGTEHILVVDDVADQRDIACRILGKLGYKVTSVDSGEEAIEYLREHQVDLVVLDMIMEPGINGLETYRRIIELRPGQKAIIASGFSESEDVKAVQRMGAGAYVKKPYTLEKIGIAVRSVLNPQLDHAMDK